MYGSVLGCRGLRKYSLSLELKWTPLGLEVMNVHKMAHKIKEKSRSLFLCSHLSVCLVNCLVNEAVECESSALLNALYLSCSLPAETDIA